jgi:MFS family permease
MYRTSQSSASRCRSIQTARSIWLLFGCQALLNAVSIGQVAMAVLIGHSLSADKTLATLPTAIQMAATMMASVPACVIFARFGRRAGFLLGAAGSLAGCLLFAAGVWRADFALYCLGAVPTGLGFGIAQHLRFAAAEAAHPSHRARAVALVMAGGVLAAIMGPEIVKRTQLLFGPALFLGSYLALATLPIFAAALLIFADLPPASQQTASRTPMRVMVARPEFIIAAAAGVAAYGSMNLVMTSTPVQMMLCGFGAADSADVIRAHAIAMYAPGFLTGRLIGRYGPHRVVCTGGFLNLGCAAVSLSGSTLFSFTAGLVLLGLGWNLMFTGATALLARAHNTAERLQAQAANDLLLFGSVACAALGSGALHNAAGWVALNLAIVPLVLLGIGPVSWQRAGRTQGVVT